MALDPPSRCVLLSRDSRHIMSDLNKAGLPASAMVTGTLLTLAMTKNVVLLTVPWHKPVHTFPGSR